MRFDCEHGYGPDVFFCCPVCRTMATTETPLPLADDRAGGGRGRGMEVPDSLLITDHRSPIANRDTGDEQDELEHEWLTRFPNHGTPSGPARLERSSPPESPAGATPAARSRSLDFNPWDPWPTRPRSAANELQRKTTHCPGAHKRPGRLFRHRWPSSAIVSDLLLFAAIIGLTLFAACLK